MSEELLLSLLMMELTKHIAPIAMKKPLEEIIDGGRKVMECSQTRNEIQRDLDDALKKLLAAEPGGIEESKRRLLAEGESPEDVEAFFSGKFNWNKKP